MDKITILLQDKQTIEKLAADPDVQIRIKDAILDGLAKRYVKTSNVVKDLLDNARAEMRKELFTGIYNNILKDE